MRIAMLGFSHETNTDRPAPTELQQFVRRSGDQIRREVDGAATVWGGFVNRAAERRVEAVTAYSADAVSSGTITASAFATMRAELVAALRGAEPFDAVALNLHGAAVAVGVDDVEGDLCSAVREIAGDRPVGAVFDLHANLTQTMCDDLDVVLPYRQYPHTDTRDRGIECIDRLIDRLSGKPRASIYLASLPMRLPATNTFSGPGAALNRACDRVEQRTGVRDCTALHGLPNGNLDVANASVVCSADDDLTAREGAEYVAKWLWFHREEFRRPMPDTASVVDLAHCASHRAGPFTAAVADTRR